MTCHLDWSLLDSTVSDALRDFINAKLDEVCQSKISEYLSKQKENQQKDPTSLISLQPLTNIKVTKIWFGTEAPLLEIMEIGPAPPSSNSINQPLHNSPGERTGTPSQLNNNSHHHISSSNITSPNASFPPQTSSVLLTNSSTSPPITKASAKRMTVNSNVGQDDFYISRQDSTASSAAVSSSSPFHSNGNRVVRNKNNDNHQNNNKLFQPPQSTASSQKYSSQVFNSTASTTMNSTRGNAAKISSLSQQHHQQSLDRGSFISSSSTTPSSTLPHPLPQTQLQQQPKQPSVLDAILGENGFQIRIHLVHSGSAGIEVFVDPEIQIRSPFFGVFSNSSSQRKRGNSNENDGTNNNGEYDHINDDDGDEENQTGRSRHLNSHARTDDNKSCGSDSSSSSSHSDDDDDDENDDRDEHDEGLIASVRFPMLFDISDFHFDIVLNVTIRRDEGIAVRIEPDRFGGEGAEGRILSSLSIVTKAGAGLLHNKKNNDHNNNSNNTKQVQDEEILIDQECARSLILKELRAVLARTLVQGIIIPLKK